MVNVARLVFLYFIVNSIRTVSLLSIQELPSNDIIINVNKGYALRRIGIYSPNVVEQIVHTFIPFNNLCLASPETAVCYYTSVSNKTNIFELVTFLASRQPVHTLSSYDSDSVSRLIRKDISQVLVQHHRDKIIKNNKSIVHFVNDQFYYQKSDEKALMTVSPNNAINTYPYIPYLQPTSAERILKQINNNKIDFNYLSDTDLKLFLTAVFSTIDSSYTIFNVQESLNVFTQLIVGQSVFALRYCSLSRDTSLHSQPCLAISTLFLTIPAHSASIFSIYRLIPLPITFNGDKYIYSNLPKVIGINSIDQTLIMWNDESDTSACIFSPIVLCQNQPVSMSLLKSSCISQLFDDKQLVTSMCQVSRSQNIEQDVMYIDDEIWLFYNIRQTYYCQVFSASNGLVETISINEPAIVHMPCNKTVACTDFQIPASLCKQHRVIVAPSFNLNITKLTRFIVPIKNMTQTLVSSYQLQSEKTIKDLMTAFKSKQSTFKRIMSDFAAYILSVICFIFVIIFLYIFKLIKYKVQKEINHLESYIEDMIDI